MAEDTKTVPGAENGKTKTKAKAKRTPPKPKPPTVVQTVQFIDLTPALALDVAGTKRRSGSGTSSRVTASMGRTGRFEHGKVYRTGTDQMCVQTTENEEYYFTISTLRAVLDAAHDMGVTRELPQF